MNNATKPDHYLKVQIRWLIRADMPEVLGIERACFSQPWTEENFLHHLRKRNCIGMVAESRFGSRNEIVGFMVYELYKPIVKLINFAVNPEDQRRGVGHQMIRRVKDKLHQQRRSQIDVFVSEQNLDAHLFFRSQEFWAVGTHRDYYENGDTAYEFNYRVEQESHDSSWYQSNLLEQPE